MIKLFATLATTAAVAIAAPAAAATFSMTGSDNVNGTYGLSDSDTVGGIGVRWSAWHAVANAGGWTYTVSTAYLGEYGTGSGATAVNDSNGGGNLHTVDNDQGFDFILLQFNQTVSLRGADLTAYQIGNSTDNDAFISTGFTGLSWTSKIDLTTQTTLANNLFANGMSIKSAAGTPAARSFLPYTQVGNVWIVAADLKNIDGVDGFKLNNLVATAAVPEPATWAMMLAGFGMVGFGMRRRAPTRAMLNA